MKIADSMVVGAGLGCASQLLFLVLGLAIASSSGGTKWTTVFLLGWGVTQWITLVPLIVQQKKQGHRRTVQGMIIMGCIGVLLSSACAGMILSG